MPLDPMQADVARIALAAAEGHDFALAGGNALIAHGLVQRMTEDVDLFTTRAGGPGQVTPAVIDALRAAGYDVQVRRAPADGDFARLDVGRGGRRTEVDLARDWRAHPPVRLEIGPVLHVQDAIANKVAAMIGRNLPRDYIDVAGAAGSTPRAQLLRAAFEHDPGLRVEDVAGAMHQLDRLRSDDFARYGLNEDAVSRLRATFTGWPRDPAVDAEGRAAHAAAHTAEQLPVRSAAQIAATSYPQPITAANPTTDPAADRTGQPTGPRYPTNDITGTSPRPSRGAHPGTPETGPDRGR